MRARAALSSRSLGSLGEDDATRELLGLLLELRELVALIAGGGADMLDDPLVELEHGRGRASIGDRSNEAADVTLLVGNGVAENNHAHLEGIELALELGDVGSLGSLGLLLGSLGSLGGSLGSLGSLGLLLGSLGEDDATRELLGLLLELRTLIGGNGVAENNHAHLEGIELALELGDVGSLGLLLGSLGSLGLLLGSLGSLGEGDTTRELLGLLLELAQLVALIVDGVADMLGDLRVALEHARVLVIIGNQSNDVADVTLLVGNGFAENNHAHLEGIELALELGDVGGRQHLGLLLGSLGLLLGLLLGSLGHLGEDDTTRELLGLLLELAHLVALIVDGGADMLGDPLVELEHGRGRARPGDQINEAAVRTLLGGNGVAENNHAQLEGIELALELGDLGSQCCQGCRGGGLGSLGLLGSLGSLLGSLGSLGGNGLLLLLADVPVEAVAEESAVAGDDMRSGQAEVLEITAALLIEGARALHIAGSALRQSGVVLDVVVVRVIVAAVHVVHPARPTPLLFAVAVDADHLVAAGSTLSEHVAARARRNAAGDEALERVLAVALLDAGVEAGSGDELAAGLAGVSLVRQLAADALTHLALGAGVLVAGLDLALKDDVRAHGGGADVVRLELDGQLARDPRVDDRVLAQDREAHDVDLLAHLNHAVAGAVDLLQVHSDADGLTVQCEVGRAELHELRRRGDTANVVVLVVGDIVQTVGQRVHDLRDSSLGQDVVLLTARLVGHDARWHAGLLVDGSGDLGLLESNEVVHGVDIAVGAAGVVLALDRLGRHVGLGLGRRSGSSSVVHDAKRVGM